MWSCSETLLRGRDRASMFVIPSKAGIQFLMLFVEKLVPGFRRDDGLWFEARLR